jgi:hypothetical protein
MISYIGATGGCATYESVKPKVLASLHQVCEALPEVEALLDKAESAALLDKAESAAETE